MKTLLQSALTGWTTYTQQGKFVALLLLAMVYLGFELRKKMPEFPIRYVKSGGSQKDWSRAKESYMTGYVYTVLITLACICPVTALILMKYQTNFYAYVWIWAAVPQTMVIAWAATDFLSNLWEKKESPQYLQKVIATLLLVGIFFLSGNPVSEWTEQQITRIPGISGVGMQQQADAPWETLDILSDMHSSETGTPEFGLWATKDIMAASRACSAYIRPVYGRSIWDASLGSYSFDTYATWQEDLYLWMSNLETTGETEYLRMDEIPENAATDGTVENKGRTIDFAACLDSVEEAGADYILLPGGLSEEAQKELQKTAGRELQPLGEYFLIKLSDEG